MRGSPEPGADLISRGQLFAVHIWQRAAAVPPPPPARPALPSRNAGSASRIWSAFLGAAGAPSGAPSGAWPGLEGGAPPGFPGSSLLWLPAAAPRQPAPRLDHGTGKGSRTWLSPCGAGGP